MGMIEVGVVSAVATALVLTLPAVVSWWRLGRPAGWSGLWAALSGDIRQTIERTVPALVESGRLSGVGGEKKCPDPDDVVTLCHTMKWAKTPDDKLRLLKCFVENCCLECKHEVE